MQTISLKLLQPNFCVGTKFERLPQELIEYILHSFIMIPQQKHFIRKKSIELCINGILKRIRYIWANYYNIRLKLELFNINNIQINLST